jgi:hypothetical protein
MCGTSEIRFMAAPLFDRSALRYPLSARLSTIVLELHHLEAMSSNKCDGAFGI